MATNVCERQMELTLNRLKARVTPATGGTVEMNQLRDDPACCWRSVIGVLGMGL